MYLNCMFTIKHLSFSFSPNLKPGYRFVSGSVTCCYCLCRSVWREQSCSALNRSIITVRRNITVWWCLLCCLWIVLQRLFTDHRKVSLVGLLSADLVPLSHTVSLTLQPLNSYASLFNAAGRNRERGRHLPSFAFPSSSSSKRSVCSSWSDCCLRMSKVLLWASFRAWTSSLCSCFRRSSRAWQRGWRWCNGDTFFSHVALTGNVWAVCELHLWKLFFWVCRGKN